MSSLVVDFDDFGCNHVISDMCQSHDCRDKLLELKAINPKFKVTLFAIPGEMTTDLTGWCQLNKDWAEIAVHGFFHKSNYECADIAYEDFDFYMHEFRDILKTCFVKGFKAPGWQIGDEVRSWLTDNGYWLADHVDNTLKRTVYPMRTYLVGDNSWHGHTWDCVGNGIYETFDELSKKVRETKEFKWVSESVS